jgi:hypothetical protein
MENRKILTDELTLFILKLLGDEVVVSGKFLAEMWCRIKRRRLILYPTHCLPENRTGRLV